MPAGDVLAAARARLGEYDRWTLGALVAALAFLAGWRLTWGASLTHDEAVYVDVIRGGFASTYYPGDLFLRHPPLGLGLLAAWDAAGLPLRAWPVPWGLAAVGLSAAALRAREATPWALAPLVASPALLPLVGVTMYPPMVAFLALAAYGWAARRPWVEAVAWNLAVLAHELALLVLAFRLAPRGLAMLRERAAPRAWLAEAARYPAAWAWGSVMLAGVLGGGDPRGGVLALVLDPSPNAAAVLALKPLIGILVLLALAPLLRWPAPGHAARGYTVAALVAAVAAPFYRYLAALVPVMAVAAAEDPPAWAGDAWPAVLVAAGLLAAGGAAATVGTGVDSLNAADLPGLVDHEEGAELLEPGETTVLRSPVSLAHVLRAQGWTVVATGDEAPDRLVLERGGEQVTLVRAETLAGAREDARTAPVDAALVPAAWSGWLNGLEADGWTSSGTAGGLVRLEAPPGGAP